MELKRNGSQPSARGPAEYFTGTVRIDQLFKAPGPARASGAYVTFEPCARSNWHTHPLGQTLIVTSGCGFVQSWGGPIKVIRPGDVVWCPAGEKHWHGASPTTAMTHIAIQRSEERRVGKERPQLCRSRWSRYHQKEQHHQRLPPHRDNAQPPVSDA